MEKRKVTFLSPFNAFVLFILLAGLWVLFSAPSWAAPPPPHPRLHPIGPPAPWKIKGPPPAGKVWFHFRGDWVLVPPPPGVGPYIWDGTVWIVDPTPPPPNSEWVSGHWTDEGWVDGHWVSVAEPAPGHVWIPGHWKDGVWIQGHWKGTPPPGKRWIPGHRAPNGRWIPGHYR